MQWLRENVRFEQSGSMVFCDEAEYDPATEDLVGRGNVRITNPDGATVTGKTLEYNNATHITKDTILLGMGSHFELWDKSTYEAQEALAMQGDMPDVLRDFSI